jgi:hypothetical protein
MKSSIARRITCTDKQVHSRLQNASSRNSQGKAMPPETTDLFEVEHIEYVADRSVDEVTDGKYASEVASATRTGVCETSKRRRLPEWS